jgi:hypothetical protein
MRVGLGAIALGNVASRERLGGFARKQSTRTEATALRAPRPSASSILFMAGAPSHLELFDNKPQLAKFDGKVPPAELIKDYRAAFITSESATLLGPKFKFAKHGKCGAELSELLPHLATVADDIAIVKSMHTDAFNHAPGAAPDEHRLATVRPTEHGRVVQLRPRHGDAGSAGVRRVQHRQERPSAGAGNWGRASCRPCINGTMFRSVGDPVLYLSNPKAWTKPSNAPRSIPSSASTNNTSTWSAIPKSPRASTSSNSRRACNFERAGVDGHFEEPKEVLEMYGAEPGKGSNSPTPACSRGAWRRKACVSCEIFHESLGSTRQSQERHRRRIARTPIRPAPRSSKTSSNAACWTTRSSSGAANSGARRWSRRQRRSRSSQPNCFTMWLAGGGVKPGLTLGETDDFGFNVTQDKVHVHDLHATMLHLLGFDHTKLTYRFQGRDFRLTDVHGELVKKLLA